MKKDGFKILSYKYYILNTNAGNRIEAECTNEEQARKLLQDIYIINIKLYTNKNICTYVIQKGSYILEKYKKN